MTNKKKARAEKLLTEVELEMMNILWARGSGTVHDILSLLPSGRTLAYTSVSTMLRILEQKGILSSRKEGRGHVYYPTLKKQDYEVKSVRHLVTNVFGGEPAQLVQRLIESEPLSDEELQSIRKLLNEASI